MIRGWRAAMALYPGDRDVEEELRELAAVPETSAVSFARRYVEVLTPKQAAGRKPKSDASGPKREIKASVQAPTSPRLSGGDTDRKRG